MRAGSRYLAFLLAALLLTGTWTAIRTSPSVSAGAGYARSLDSQPRLAPTDLTSSVIVRPDTSVRTASIDEYVANRAIVRLRDDVTDPVAVADELAARLGFEPTHIYQATPKGFAASMSAEAIDALTADNRVTAVIPDALRTFDLVPAGVERIGTRLNPIARLNDVDGGERVDADVAVLDTGIDAYHPDLNVVGGADCTGQNDPYTDDFGHGTAIAGVIGALDDGVGVVGVAPGVRLWSIKIGGAAGIPLSWELCGLATLVENASVLDVANLSFGGYGLDGSCASSLEHQLVCDAVAGGVTIFAAAGNDARNAANTIPATFSQVIAVSAFVDTDGRIGGLGPSTSAGSDDRFATFSNYGADVDLAAPGVEILTTWPTDRRDGAGFGINIVSGTSFSAPHAAGAAALVIDAVGRVGPTSVRSRLLTGSDAVTLSGDPDGIHERVLYVGPVAPTCEVTATTVTVKSQSLFSCTGFRADEKVNVSWDTVTKVVASFTASNTGQGSKNLTVPTLTSGMHNVFLVGSTSGKRATRRIRVIPGLTMAPAGGVAGTRVTGALAGFVAGEKISIAWYDSSTRTHVIASNVVASTSGAASFTFTAPAGAIGGHKIEATGNQGSVALSKFKLSAVAVQSVATTTSTPTASATPLATESPVVSASPTVVPTSTATSLPSPTPTVLPTESLLPTATSTPESAPTEPPPTETPSPTATPTPIESAEPTHPPAPDATTTP